MIKRQKRWMYLPPKASKAKVPEDVKKDMEEKAVEFVETILKPKHSHRLRTQTSITL